MNSAEINRRRRKSAMKELTSPKLHNPMVSTTKALLAIDADCDRVEFHGILEELGYSTPITNSPEKGYEFNLPSDYGIRSFLMNTHSFRWTKSGIKFMTLILDRQGIKYQVPEKLPL